MVRSIQWEKGQQNFVVPPRENKRTLQPQVCLHSCFPCKHTHACRRNSCPCSACSLHDQRYCMQTSSSRTCVVLARYIKPKGSSQKNCTARRVSTNWDSIQTEINDDQNKQGTNTNNVPIFHLITLIGGSRNVLISVILLAQIVNRSSKRKVEESVSPQKRRREPIIDLARWHVWTKTLNPFS